MKKVPVFIERSSAAPVLESWQICSRIRGQLLRTLSPLPLAGTSQEVVSAAEQLAEAGVEPALFVVNTFGCKEMLPDVATLLGHFPVLFLRRGMYAGQSGLMKHLSNDAVGRPKETLALIRQVKPQLTAIWTYGPKNADTLAERASRLIVQFLNDGNFLPIEREFEGEALSAT